MERPLITSFQSSHNKWTHWVRVPETRRDEFHNWLSESIPGTKTRELHSEPIKGIKHIVCVIETNNLDHTTLLRLTWG